MEIIVHRSTRNQGSGVIVDLSVLENSKLSLKAKGIYVTYCKLQQVDGIANPTIGHLVQVGKEGYNSTASGLKELREAGVIASASCKPQKPGFVYLAFESGTGLYKIGLSKNPKRRIKSLSNASHSSVTLVAAIAVSNMGLYEDLLHEQFSSKRVHGEWFALDVEDVDYIKAL